MQKERDHQENLDVGRKIVLKWILDGMGWYGLDLAQDRDQWSALVNTVMNHWVPKKFWESPRRVSCHIKSGLTSALMEIQN
jgi:hypothetical protein